MRAESENQRFGMRRVKISGKRMVVGYPLSIYCFPEKQGGSNCVKQREQAATIIIIIRGDSHRFTERGRICLVAVAAASWVSESRVE